MKSALASSAFLFLAGCSSVPASVSSEPETVQAAPQISCDNSEALIRAALQSQDPIPPPSSDSLDPAQREALRVWQSEANEQFHKLANEDVARLMDLIQSSIDGQQSPQLGYQWILLMRQGVSTMQSTVCYPDPPNSLSEGQRAYFEQADRFRIRAMQYFLNYLTSAESYLRSPAPAMRDAARERRNVYLLELAQSAAVIGQAVRIGQAARSVQPYTPERGSAVRTEVMDALRTNVEDVPGLGQQTIFTIQAFSVLGDWALVKADPQNRDGSPTSIYDAYLGENPCDHEITALLGRDSSGWRVVERAVGPCDSAIDVWLSQHGVSERIMDSFVWLGN